LDKFLEFLVLRVNSRFIDYSSELFLCPFLDSKENSRFIDFYFPILSSKFLDLLTNAGGSFNFFYIDSSIT